MLLLKILVNFRWLGTLLTCFSVIAQLPWKPMKSIVEYYYMWKTTDRCVQQASFELSQKHYRQ